MKIFADLLQSFYIGIWAIYIAIIRISFPHVSIVQHWSGLVNSFLTFFDLFHKFFCSQTTITFLQVLRLALQDL